MFNLIKYRIFIIKKLLPYTDKYLIYFSVVTVLNCISLCSGLLSPQIYKVFINSVVLGGQVEKLLFVILGSLILFIIDTIVFYIKYITETNYCNKTKINVKCKILENLFQKPYDSYEKMDIADIKMRIEDDTSQVEKFITSQSLGLFFLYSKIIVSLVLLFSIEWHLAIFSIIIIPLTIFLDKLLSEKEKRINEKSRMNDEKTAGWLLESIQGWREIKSLSLAKNQKRKYIKFLNKSAIYFGQWINYWTSRTLVIPKIKDTLIMQFGLYFFGGLLIIKNDLTIGSLLVFSSYLGQLSQSIYAISGADADLIANMPHTERLLEELSQNEITESKIELDDCKSIKLENVSFSYPNSDFKIINNINLEIKKGDRIAIIGHSGCGKTTLLKLITGILSPDSGKITYNEIDSKLVDIDSLHAAMNYIMQENFLLNTTIRENLLYGNSNASDTQILAACEKALLVEFVNTLPDGLDTIIGEKGIKLSGGQRQRIVLARMFLNSSNVYIFDEATSNLDPHNESLIHNAINNIDPDKIVIIVSHRKSSLNLCNKFFSLENESFVSNF